MCREHWWLVPEEIRDRVSRLYRADRYAGTISDEYVSAKREAIETVAAAESGRKKEPEQTSLFGTAA